MKMRIVIEVERPGSDVDDDDIKTAIGCVKSDADVDDVAYDVAPREDGAGLRWSYSVEMVSL